jgi:hypothetical protein
MATWERFAFGSVEQLVNFLNGALIGDQNLAAGAAVDGLTFIVDVGAGEVTISFTTAKGRPWTVQEIVDKINASVAGLARVYSRNNANPYTAGTDQRVLLERDGTLVVKATGTANALLGFPAAITTAAPVVNTDVYTIEYQHSGATDLWVALLYR